MNKPWENFKYNPFNRKKTLSAEEETESVFEQLKRYSGEDLKKPLTRAENRLTHKGKFEIDPETRKLTPTGKTDRLKYRLNWIILWLVLGCVITWLVLFFL
ncbi:hypothetical protein PAF15_05090 [Weissella koreensis]|uniref:Uncharacterized protein n=1 Tax=Weissella koreensis TaxID=165096 RepID=A0A7H1MMX2_9LACO|nr:hypothetical protein [Weissella koreensis]AEJ23990.1 hypothetical protein WKK_05600 [Weissella koreensis KACC 15510]AVH75604.1 hypothetical protein C4597_06235 [Weissella koreensis]EJF34591.1 hypothetical protein JC2156_14310 [Weissella koreensis KCTC 3621]MCZ9311318.1 hypothetical protein [Weissella koreensis]QGN20827.1 hypothetical protein GKC51_06215 [Weissella koreensis]